MEGVARCEKETGEDEEVGDVMMSTAHTERPPPSAFALGGGRLLFSFKCVATVWDGYMLEGAEES